MFSDKPGYNASPTDVFGPQVDFSFWDRILRAGSGANANARYSATAGLRALTSHTTDIEIRRLPSSRGQTVIPEGRTAQTGFFMPG